MVKDVLHIVRKRADPMAMAVIAQQTRNERVGVVLVQDGVWADVPETVDVCVNQEDARARGVETRHRRVGYDEIAELVVAAARVMVW